MRNDDMPSPDGKAKRGKAASFFCIDRRTWNALCQTTDINVAATYLTIAQGFCKVHSKWSAKSVETYAGISRLRASKYIALLIGSRFLQHGPDHSKAKPQYTITRFEELPSVDGRRDTSAEKDPTDTLWLPTSLVQGTPGGTASPLCELVATQDILPLRILVDLYAEQHLVADGGISRNVIYGKHRKDKVGERGEVIIWAFVSEERWARGDSERWLTRYQDSGKFWSAIKTLIHLGLLSCIEHLTQSDSPDSEITHALPYRTSQIGSIAHEDNVSIAAHRAGWALLTPDLQRMIEDGETQANRLVPILRHLSRSHCFGIFRLTHRPHTTLTSEWMAQSSRQSEAYVALYRKYEATGRLAGELALERFMDNLEQTA